MDQGNILVVNIEKEDHVAVAVRTMADGSSKYKTIALYAHTNTLTN